MNSSGLAVRTTKFGRPNFSPAQNLSDLRRKIERDFADAQIEPSRILQLALNEAEALAEASGFPQLTFPALAQEKVELASAWLRRQKAIRESTRSISFAA